MAQTTYPSPLNEQTLQQLQGGVKGRFARSFSVLQGNVDTLERYLQRHTDGAMLDDTEPLFEAIHEQIGQLEHLSGNAVDILSGTVLHDPQHLQPMDIAAFLQDFCALTNAELACRGAKARITLDLPAEPLCLPASEALLTSLFTNLLTNSVRARRDTAITIDRGAGGALRYADTGPGPGPEALALLRGGTIGLTMLHTGSLGLLVALACARELGWSVTLDDAVQQGFAIEMQLPASVQAAAAPALHSAAGAEALRARLQRLLQREMDLALR